MSTLTSRNQSGESLSDYITLRTVTCGACGILFAIPLAFDEEKRAEGQNGRFYCPNGHPRVYRETEAMRVRREMDEKLAEAQREINYQRQWKERERENRLKAERQHVAAKGQITKLKKRVGNGVCPCCNRTFSNLQRHMEHLHPDYKRAE